MSWYEYLVSCFWQSQFTVYIITALIATLVSLLINRRQKSKDLQSTDRIIQKSSVPDNNVKKGLKIFYASQTGTAKSFSEKLSNDVSTFGVRSEVIDLSQYEPEDNLVEETDGQNACVFIVASYIDGKPPDKCDWFFKWMEEASNDFRVQKTMLKGLKYTVFGLGNSLYKENYNKVGVNLDKWLHTLSGDRIMSCGEGNDNVADSKHGGVEEDFKAWKEMFLQKMLPFLQGTPGCQDDDDCHCHGDVNKEATYETSSDEGEDLDNDGEERLRKTDGVVDVEDLGAMMGQMELSTVDTEMENGVVMVNGGVARKAKNKKIEAKEMMTPLLRQSLTKQGYKLIGSHSGVKLCRWTKSMLRGRGGCYKHTFYGIESHRCMETTPSLACANKCVFCWRHHTNPVGTEWKWKMDDAQTILDGAMKNHYQLIKQFRGVPGVQLERFQEAMRVKHCALSLVGEPIMYPEINKFVKLLHRHEISTFLVTNAQFPDAIKDLVPVTQLYVSVDASTKESLKKIDRPLFRDFWPRFIESLKALSEKGQRTVYRLTLVKSWNVEEIQAYADLVQIGRPDFIEIKGVTYCGESKASSLTMENIPWHREVVSFVQKLTDQLPGYDIACEHEHSNCVLIANKKFKVDGEWWTWIDYDKFHELIKTFENSDGAATFTAEDYMAKTPNWAVFGCDERGLDPVETRFHRKKKKDISGC
ncbi:S-adenosyl-L-methionine-dependent tRNA 4-demethylwyosine synthase TYW1-like [Saccoglossus kowalevskii]|uniref:tRNA 4-demethylwyosine synthase (AdoMet-dependent) n=1 Tax=Saccoglossus kowalevskii TaxID=10224 RepID=A0ABM0GP28_SACKO|nr:PREDICTED: tRNA wybutosine-synthesizing protein 1 homolog [Saccoglossus kowalevskii]